MTRYEDAEEAENLSDRYVHRHYTISKNGNGSAVNKLVYSVAAVLAITFLGLLSFIGVKVWDISERMVKVETIIADRLPLR